ncbi:MFS transporter [uncultured Nostoc sp.]|uniref:MFS transporter n=1 Tax=uncultured Nostoc sp. TaxID=340711 RepID=UPI0035CADC35
MMKHSIPTEMRIFILIWLGQLVSFIGSGLTDFALGVWVYQRTGSATQLALISLSSTLPLIVCSAVAGTLVDRWNRRWVMILSDCGAGLITGVLVLFMVVGRLEIWQMYLATAISSCFRAFQWPAYTASITLLVPKKHLDRANGMIQFAEAATLLISPVLGSVLLLIIQLQGIFLLDFATFVFSLITLLLVRFPNLKTTDANQAGNNSLLRDVIYGWGYINARPGLRSLLIFFATANFLFGIEGVLVKPLVLSFASSTVLGIIQSIGGIGMLLGSLGISTLGGPKRRINTIFVFMLLSGLCTLFSGVRASVALLILTNFLSFFGQPIINTSIQVIFQKKVAPEVQGRVFAIRRMIAWSTVPLAYLVGGWLAEKVFEPLMVPNGFLAATIGQIIGVGSGHGIGLLFIVVGTLLILVTIAAYQYPPLRLVEDELPDVIPMI